MGVFSDLQQSKRFRAGSAITVLVDALLAFRRGNKKAAALLVGGAALAYRSSMGGVAVQILYRLWRRLT